MDLIPRKKYVFVAKEGQPRNYINVPDQCYLAYSDLTSSVGNYQTSFMLLNYF